LLVTLALGVIASRWVVRDVSRMMVLALIAIIGGVLGILYTGTFSAASIGLVLCIYFFCRSENLASAIAIYALAATAHAMISMLVLARFIEEPGFYPVGRHASVQALVTGQLILQMAYALAFWLARVTRRASLRSIQQLQRATRLAAQRDVQLAELRRDLDRALEIGGPGRFTGVTVGGWELGTVIGRGAMGEVYAATNSRGEQSAVKLLRRELLAQPRHVERFLREVRAASALDSPHVVRVLATASPSDAMPFLAMERLSGQTLATLVRAGAPLADEPIARLVTQIGGVLERAREAGIVHRDVKPQNLFLTNDEIWKLLDFGIAQLANSTGTLTRGGAIGTPAYMAPEQARGETVDHRADVYALGAVLYRCITGRPAYGGGDTPALLYAVVHEPPLRPSALQPVSPALEQVLALAMAKSRDERLQTAGELVAAFVAARAGALPPALERRAERLVAWRDP